MTTYMAIGMERLVLFVPLATLRVTGTEQIALGVQSDTEVVLAPVGQLLIAATTDCATHRRCGSALASMTASGVIGPAPPALHAKLDGKDHGAQNKHQVLRRQRLVRWISASWS
jgi:hypothetical protein